MEAVRAFIAIELPEETRRQLDDIEKQIQDRAGQGAHKAVRWVPASNMHLTLKFLGEVSAANIQSLARTLYNQAYRQTEFDISIGGLGAFPNIRRPRVIWVGATAPSALFSLQKGIDAETRQLGYPTDDRPFSPHLTLGRIAQNARPEEVIQVAQALSETKVGELGRIKVNCIHLFRSDLRPTGAVYTPLHTFSFR